MKNPKSYIGWYILLLFALLLIWASFTGAFADMLAAFLAPSFLERTDV